MIFDLLKNLSGSVGRTGDNNKADVVGVETALGSQGYLDLGKTDGPTGYFGTREEDAIKGFQKANGLKADGVITPGLSHRHRRVCLVRRCAGRMTEKERNMNRYRKRKSSKELSGSFGGRC